MSGMEFPPFNVAHIAAALCDEIERFFAAVEEHCDAERLAAFGDARSIAIAARPNFARYL
jgi:phage host-nuclease inhibitor protein Gam